MKLKDALKSIFLTWDLYAGGAIILVISFLLPNKIALEVAKEIFLVSISALSIIFSVFFAALTVLISAGENEFVRFLEEEGTFKKIIWAFKATLALLFISLLASIILFIIVLNFVPYSDAYHFPKWGLMFYAFFAIYALLAAINSSFDAIKYSELRAKYIEATKNRTGKQ